MNASQIARALADIIVQKPDLEKSLREHLAKWMKSTLMKGPTLSGLRNMHASGGGEVIAWYLGTRPESDLVRLAKKLDPYFADLQTKTSAGLGVHLNSLIAGRVEPSARPVRPTKKSAPKKRPVEEILRLASAPQRRMELKKLTPTQLKNAIKKHGLHAGSLSSRPSKTEMIEHIEASIVAGWPASRTVLDDSKY